MFAVWRFFIIFATVNQQCITEMPKILKVKNVDDYCKWVGAESVHPLL